MAQKKYKKRHSNSTMAAKKLAADAKLADEKDRARKRMNPTARTLLLGDLVFLALISILDTWGALSPIVSGFCTIVGVVLLMAALWFQFGPNSRPGGGNGGGKWPGIG